QPDVDRDFFAMDLRAGEIVQVTCTAVDDTRCRLLHSMGFQLGDAVLTETDDTHQERYILNPFVDQRVTVQPFTRGRYTLTLEQLGMDDHGNFPTSATPFALGESVGGTLETPSDIDVFAVELEGGQRYVLSGSSLVRFDVTAPDSGGSTPLVPGGGFTS